MKTHFIFNQSVLANPEILPLISVLLKNKFPVAVISGLKKTRELRQIISLPELTLLALTRPIISVTYTCWRVRMLRNYDISRWFSMMAIKVHD